VSRGNLKPVPNVVGLDEDDAVQRLREAGFVAQVVPGEPDAQDAGEVVDQDPNANEEARVGTRVRIVVAQEPEEPDPTDDPTDDPTAPPPSSPPAGG
jgi:serine/threonine-protein kinase